MRVLNYTAHLSEEDIRRMDGERFKALKPGTIWFLLVLTVSLLLMAACVSAQEGMKADFQEHKAWVKDMASIEGFATTSWSGTGWWWACRQRVTPSRRRFQRKP